jgi:hypothetical protein
MAKKLKKVSSKTAADAPQTTPPAVQNMETGAPEAGDSTSVELPPPMTAFGMAPFAAPVVAALTTAFQAPTPIQAQSWPIALAGCDLIAVAKTGSGKTLGFLLPAFHLTGGASCTGGPRVLVLAPTRELAVQINAECDKFGGYFGCTSTCIYGGAPIGAQQSILRQQQPTVVVATCGRLCDLMTRSSLSLGEASYVVLDEADRMLDMGFEPQIKQIFEALPTKRQTLFFTATWPKVNTAAALCQRARARMVYLLALHRINKCRARCQMQSIRKLAAKFLRPEGKHMKRVFVGTSADAELEANTAVSQTFIQARVSAAPNLWPSIRSRVYWLLCRFVMWLRLRMM